MLSNGAQVHDALPIDRIDSTIFVLNSPSCSSIPSGPIPPLCVQGGRVREGGGRQRVSQSWALTKDA